MVSGGLGISVMEELMLYKCCLLYTSLCDGDVTLRFEKDETGAWTWFDDPAFPLDQTALEDLLALPATLDSGETVADVQELAVYGMEATKKYITVTSDGVDVVYYLGDQDADGR